MKLECIVPFNESYKVVKTPTEFEKLTTEEKVIVYKSVISEILFSELLYKMEQQGLLEKLDEDYFMPVMGLTLSASYLEDYLVEELSREEVDSIKKELEEKTINQFKDFLDSEGCLEELH